MRNAFWIFTSALLLAASAIPARANLITDPGFESCAGFGAAPPGWTRSSGNVFCAGNSHTGSWAANMGGGSASMSQTIATIAGDNYDFSFWVETSVVTSPASLIASFGSIQVLDLVNPASFSFIKEDFTVTAAGTSTTIEFDNTTTGGSWAVDDVSVTDQGPVAPEPASLVLLASGLFAIAWYSRRRTRDVVRSNNDSRVSSSVR